MAKLRRIQKTESGPDYTFECPGCNCHHGVWTEKRNSLNALWTFNGDINKPTFSPSLLVRYTKLPDVWEKDESGNYILGPDGRIKGAKDMVCHSFVKDGMIQFLSDCTHELAGQTVELPEV